MISACSEEYLEHTLSSWTKSKSLATFSDAALDSYRTQFRGPNSVHAMCEDYRAGATIDRQLDIENLAVGRKIHCPLHFVWSNHGFPAKTDDPKALWGKWALNVSGTAIDAGHFPQEENPDNLLETFLPFYRLDV